jgi:hypothetical protein
MSRAFFPYSTVECAGLPSTPVAFQLPPAASLSLRMSEGSIAMSCDVSGMPP